MILVSACLLGHKVKYSGGSNPHELLMKYNERGQFMAVCPECLGKLPIPRPPVEIQQADGEAVLAGRARVRSAAGKDVTSCFLQGAREVLQTAAAYGVRIAILKENSPSCGVHAVYDGSFSRKKLAGQGVCAALLARQGIRLYSEKDMTEELLEKLLAEDKNARQ